MIGDAMRKTMYLTLLTFLLMLLPFQVGAQGEVKIGSLQVDIWPEYDQPAVLLIYDITLIPSTTLPTNLAIRIPASAQINAVAVSDPTKGLVNSPYDTSVSGEWATIKLTATSANVRVEYYTPLKTKGTARHIQFVWPGDYSVDQAEINFLKPFGSENVSISLPPTNIAPGQDGLTNYQIQTTNLAAGQPLSLTIDYERQTDDLAISSLPVQASSTPGPDTPGRVSMTGILPWILAGIGALLIASGIIGFVVWQRGNQRIIKGKKHKRAPSENEDEFTYCPHCGKRAQEGDIFCRTCGTRLKR
jgi:hypothetical protein